MTLCVCVYVSVTFMWLCVCANLCREGVLELISMSSAVSLILAREQCFRKIICYYYYLRDSSMDTESLEEKW